MNDKQKILILKGLLVGTNTMWMLLLNSAVRQLEEVDKKRQYLGKFTKLVTDGVYETAPEIMQKPDIQKFLLDYQFSNIVENYKKDN